MKNNVIISSGQIFLVVLIGVLTISCNQPQKNKADDMTTTLEQQENVVAQWQQDIQLDQGALWQANNATSAGIVNMSRIIENSTPADGTENKQLAQDLNQEMNTLIRKCTMTGPSHDNLHIYLEPLLKKLAKLTDTESAEEGKQLTNEIQSHLQAFSEYFI